MFCGACNRRAGLHSAGVTFDKERRSTESGAMARSLQGIGHILEVHMRSVLVLVQ